MEQIKCDEYESDRVKGVKETSCERLYVVRGMNPGPGSQPWHPSNLLGKKIDFETLKKKIKKY